MTTTDHTILTNGDYYPSVQYRNIQTPHPHDVLSGRGNFVNYHSGNEHFRALVRQHKMAYVACPKQQKARFSRLIVDEIRSRHPPGRFLKQDPETNLWHDIGDKKALDKTRQALREGAPEIAKQNGQLTPPEVANQNTKVGKSLSKATFYDGMRKGASADTCGSNVPLVGIGEHTDLSVETKGMFPPETTHSAPGVGTMAMSGRMSLPSRTNLSPGAFKYQGGDTTAPLSGTEYGDYTKALHDTYASELEPTPIHPIIDLRVSGAESISSKSSGTMGPEPRKERSNSLTFDSVFTKDSDSTSKARTRGMHNSSHMSAMSFSIGDISAVFEDSMRISDSRVMSEKSKSSSPVPDYRLVKSSQLDMSVATFSDPGSLGPGSMGLGSLANMSINRGFQDSTDSEELISVKKEGL